jgi:predicted lipoprotein with Yx(FWY)xxD motif
MPAQPKPSGPPVRRSRVILVALFAGVALAALAAVAVARTMTLNVARNAKVTNFNSHVATLENVAVDSRGFVVYTLSGETTHHVKCTRASGCLSFWFPVTASSAKKLAKAKGIDGKLRIWHRGNISQVTLKGHPLYTFMGDTRKRQANGQQIRSFGGTWKVVTANVKSNSPSQMQPNPTPQPPAPVPPYPTPGY